MSSIAWEISAAEYEANIAQFNALNPQMGRIDGNTARSILMKSNLSSQILAQIWALSDLNRDGMLDEKEFSIAMRLTRNCIAGAQLPPSLPPSMYQIPTGFAPQSMMGSSMPMMSSGIQPLSNFGSPPAQPAFPVYNTAPPSSARSMSISGASGPPTPGTPGRQLANWTIPHNNKLKYSQQFNNFDKQRVGFLSGQVGRSALGQSGLPTQTLAHIWGLSDVNRDGRLSVDEFYIAMHMIDMHKAGYTLPDTTPPELVQMCGISRSANNSPALEPGALPAQKSPAPKTFEDKRMDNFAKGQQELERRRQVLMEEENRRRAEQERREREEMERRERERLEKERKREAERQAEMERLRILEEARMEEERRREAEREAVRLEQEKLRNAEIEKQKLRELQAHKQQETERTAQRQQRNKTLNFQLQALDEKQADTDGQITTCRDRIKEITNEIDGMRGQRDEKMKKISELQSKNQQLSVQAQEIAHQLLQLQSANKDIAVRRAEIENGERRRTQAKAAVEAMKTQLEQLRQKSVIQKETTEKKKIEASQKKHELTQAREEYKRVTTLLSQLQIQARAKLVEVDAVLAARIAAEQEKAIHEAQAALAAVTPQVSIEQKTNGTSSQHLPPASTSGTTKYRAIYEFVARSEDELSFQPGDVILVFEGHNAEPGWRAGQIRDKVGWYPEAFAEPIAAVASHPSQPIQNMPPNVTPSPSLDRIPEESAIKFNSMHEETSSSSPSVICTCVALFTWKAKTEEDLSFVKGDIIEVIQQQEMKWKGRKADGKIGYFPKSYVKIQSTSKPASASQSMEKSTSSLTGSTPTTPTTIQGALSHQSSHQMPHSASQQSVGGEWYIAMFEFEAAESTDLPLIVGDKILVIEKNDAWWKGRCNGREGIFPANYVEKYAEPVATKTGKPATIICRVRAVADFDGGASNQLSLRIGDEVAVREKSDAGWWEGELTRDGKTISGWFPADYALAIEGSAVTSPGEISATALFDYNANQADEISFKTGDTIIIDIKEPDNEWWTGHHPSNPSQKGVFPASYVQLSTTPALYETVPSLSTLYDIPPIQPPAQPSTANQLYDLPPTSEYQSALYDLPPVQEASPSRSKKFTQLSEELLGTEERFLSDLVLAKKLFYQNLLSLVERSQLDAVFLNWDELITVSKRIFVRLKRGDSAGGIFLAEIDALSAFVTFCKGQQGAIEALDTLLASSPETRSMYNQCCASPYARGMSLNYFILIPLGRITRYPLLLEKLLKESPPTSQDHMELEIALQLVVSLVSEVNRAVSEVETLALLYWSQQHIKCPSLQLEFSSSTRSLGPRQFLHSGVLYKAKSGRLLVAILYTDFLLLTTAEESINEPESFKITKSTENKLVIYRKPYLIENLRIEPSKDQEIISLLYGEEAVQLKAVSRNSAKLWTARLVEAVDNSQITLAERLEKKKNPSEQPIFGRLLIELMTLHNISLKLVGSPPHVIKVSLGKSTESENRQSHSFEIDALKKDLHLTMQFPFSSTDVSTSTFGVSLYQKKVFRPDAPVLEKGVISLKELITEFNRSQHNGPIIKPIPLRRSSGHGERLRNMEGVVVKFVIQLYESEI